MEPVWSYLSSQPPNVQDIMHYLCGLFSRQTGVRLLLRYRIPFVFGHSWICYLNPLKKGGVELVFIRGLELEDPFGLLQSKGRRMVKGIYIKSMEEIPEGPVLDLFIQAWVLDESVYQARKEKTSPSPRSRGHL